MNNNRKQKYLRIAPYYIIWQFRIPEIDKLTMRYDNISGAIPALITPFEVDNSIDLVTWKNWLAWHNAQTTQAAVVFGSTGEGLSITMSERELLLKIARKQFDKTALIVGVSSPSTEQAIILAQQAKDHGADAILLTTPYYVRPSQDGLCLHYQKIALSVAIPIILYTVPSRTGVDVDDQTLLTLAEEKTIIGIKDAGGDISRLKRLIHKLPSDFLYLGGNDDEIIENIEHGGAGTVSVVANLVPNAVESVIRNYQANQQWSKGKFSELQPLIEVIAKHGNPQVIKYMIQSSYSISSTMRLPLTPLSEAAKTESDHAMRLSQITPEEITF
jgi:4-hydroxy-tetrahydrodipicolinate synthase